MSRQEARDQVRAEVVGHRREDPQTVSRLRVYRRWCASNGQLAEPPAGPWPDDYPGPVLVLLRFLHAHYPTWSWNYVNDCARTVLRELRRDHDIPDDGRIQHYLQRVRTELGAYKLKPTDAFTTEQVIAAPVRMEAEVHPLSPRAVRLRGVVAAAEAIRVDPTVPACVIPRLRRKAFNIRPDAVIITADSDTPRLAAPETCQYPGCAHPVRPGSSGGPAPRYCEQRDPETNRVHNSRTAYLTRKVDRPAPREAAKAKRAPRYRLDAERQPEMYAALVAALDAADDAEFPLAPPVEDGDEREDWERLKTDRESLLLAWQRALPTLAGNSDSRPRWRELRKQIADSWAAGRVEDRVWWLAQLDEWLWLRRRDAAYALTGIVNARRHIELERLTLGDLKPTDGGGYRYEIDNHKGNALAVQRGGKKEKLLRRINHIADCPAHCPACAMRDHLEVRRRSGAGDNEPLFVGLQGEAFGIGGASCRLRRLAALVEDLYNNPDGTPQSTSTRSLRVSGATSAHQAGMTYREIADEVTGHRSEDQAMLYVRRHDAFSCELVLRLDGSERSTAAGRDAANERTGRDA